MMKRILLFLSLVLFANVSFVSCNKTDACGDYLLIYMNGHDELWGMDISAAGCEETVSIYAERENMSEPTPVVYGKELIISEEGNKLGEGKRVPFVYDEKRDRMVAEDGDVHVETTTSTYQADMKHPKGECLISMGANPLDKERRVWVVLVYDMNEEWEKIPNRQTPGQEGIVVQQPAAK
jgi:hypothetical protein